MKFENDHPLPMQLCEKHSVQRDALLAVYTQGKNYAQLYTLVAVGKRGVWGRTLQSGDKSDAVYLPLGLSTRNLRKQADILLVTPVTTRKDDERGVYFSLQPLPSRESTNELVEDAADIFFDEDGLYRQAVVAESSQEPEDARKDRRSWVDMLDSSSKDSNKILCKCRLPEDMQTVHLHGQLLRSVRIPTIITVSPIESDSFQLWMQLAKEDGFFRVENAHEIAQAKESEKRSVSTRSSKDSDTLHQRLDLHNVLNGLIARITQNAAAVELLLPEPQHQADGGEGHAAAPTMTLRQVQQNLSDGRYIMDASLLSDAKAARHQVVAPVMAMLEDVARVWAAVQDKYPLSAYQAEYKLCKQYETIWSDECRKQGGLLKELEEQRKQQVRLSKECPRRSSMAPSAASAAASIAEVEDVEMDEEEEKSEAGSCRGRGASAAAAAAPPTASHDLMDSYLHQLLRFNKQSGEEMQARKAELVRVRKKLDAERRMHAADLAALRLQHQQTVLSLQSDASASAPVVAELELARTTIADRDAAIADRDAELAQLRSSAAADLDRVRQECAAEVARVRREWQSERIRLVERLEDAEAKNKELLEDQLLLQRQQAELAQRLLAKSAAAAAGHKHPRPIQLIDDDQPPPARQRTALDQQNGEQKERES